MKNEFYNPDMSTCHVSFKHKNVGQGLLWYVRRTTGPRFIILEQTHRVKSRTL